MAYKRDYKLCLMCHTTFEPLTKAHKFCSESCKGKYKYAVKDVTTESQYSKISGDWRRYLQRLLYVGGRKRDQLTVDTLLEVYDFQKGLCALTGIELTCRLEVGKNFPTNASVDRIEAGGPYIKENIQLVCKAVNSFRGTLPVDEFVWWCRRVVKHNDLC